MFGPNDSVFAVPTSSDTILSGRIPYRITPVTMSELTHLTAAGPSVLPRNSLFVPMDAEVLSTQGDLEIMPRVKDSPFATVRVAVLRFH